jgi:hypothetical protein
MSDGRTSAHGDQALQTPRFRLRLWHLIAAVAIEGLIAGEVAWILGNAGADLQGLLLLTFLICSMLVLDLGFLAILVWFVAEKKP